MSLAGKTVVLAVTGSIAAYKSVEVARLCLKAGARVIPVMTASAKHFVGPITLSGICGESVRDDVWDPKFSGELHVTLSAEADLLVIVPATADLLARLAAGRCDDLVSALALCARGPVLAVPAMHPRMWAHPATEKNVSALARQGRVTIVGPVFGEVASGDTGLGRMSDPTEVFQAIVRALAPSNLHKKKIVVTAGPTLEDLDPVRFLGNRSTGKMGFAIAERAAARGAEVTLIAGPVSLSTPSGVKRVDVRAAMEMREALAAAAKDADAVIMSAAVADYRPAEVSPGKLKKDGETASITLVRNPDLLAELGAARSGTKPLLVGFAVETGSDEEIAAYARGKLEKKKIDLVVANAASDGFGGDDNRAMIVSAESTEALAKMSKRALADHLLDIVLNKLGA